MLGALTLVAMFFVWLWCWRQRSSWWKTLLWLAATYVLITAAGVIVGYYEPWV